MNCRHAVKRLGAGFEIIRAVYHAMSGGGDRSLHPSAMTDIASHRGGALLWPENSRIAFENTARLPVEQVEFDVHPTRDGKIVVIHDGTLERTTDGTGPVARRDWADLQRVALKGTEGQRI